jgi:hypothetical protein
MITEEEYKKWKPLIEEYEENEAADALANSMYCISCQALEAHDCFCDDEPEDSEDCPICCGNDGKHFIGCPHNHNPFDNLISDGYD